MDGNNVRWFLQPGEMLLWEGSPEWGIRLRKDGWLMGLFSLFACGLFICMLCGVIKWNSFCVSIVLTGALSTVAFFFVQPRDMAKTRYAVTDTRVIIMRRREIVSMTYRQIPVVFREIEKDGSGTLWFKRPEYRDDYTRRSRRIRRRVPGVGFLDIADAERVCRLIEGQLTNC